MTELTTNLSTDPTSDPYFRLDLDESPHSQRLEALSIPDTMGQELSRLAWEMESVMERDEHEAFIREATDIMDYLRGRRETCPDAAHDLVNDLLTHFVGAEGSIEAAPPMQGNPNKDLFGAALLLSNIVEEELGPQDGLVGFYAYELRQMLNGNPHTVMPVSRTWRVTEKDGEVKLQMQHDMSIYAHELIDYFGSLGFPTLKKENIVPVDYCEAPGSHFGTAMAALTEADPEFLALKARVAAEAEAGNTELLSFINTSTSERLRSLLGLTMMRNVDDTENMNNKGSFQGALSSRGLPGAKNLRVKSVAQAAIASLWLKHCCGDEVDMGARAKANRAASGYGNFKGKTPRAVVERLRQPDCATSLATKGFSLMEWLHFEQKNSPGVLLFIHPEDPTQDVVFGVADQVLKGENHVYEGSMGSRDLAFWEQKYPGISARIDLLRAVLREEKAFGFQGIDYVQENYPGHDRHGRMTEIEDNCRLTGQTHVANLARQLDYDYYGVHNSVQVPQNMSLDDFVAELEARGIHYQPEVGGVFVTNHSNSPNGRMMIGILALSMEEVERFYQAVDQLSSEYAAQEVEVHSQSSPETVLNWTRAQLLEALAQM